MAISRATMNQFMSNLVCEDFHHVLLKYCHENVEMQKRRFDDITLTNSVEVVSMTSAHPQDSSYGALLLSLPH